MAHPIGNPQPRFHPSERSGPPAVPHVPNVPTWSAVIPLAMAACTLSRVTWATTRLGKRYSSSEKRAMRAICSSESGDDVGTAWGQRGDVGGMGGAEGQGDVAGTSDGCGDMGTSRAGGHDGDMHHGDIGTP